MFPLKRLELWFVLPYHILILCWNGPVRGSLRETWNALPHLSSLSAASSHPLCFRFYNSLRAVLPASIAWRCPTRSVSAVCSSLGSRLRLSPATTQTPSSVSHPHQRLGVTGAFLPSCFCWAAAAARLSRWVCCLSVFAGLPSFSLCDSCSSGSESLSLASSFFHQRCSILICLVAIGGLSASLCHFLGVQIDYIIKWCTRIG